MTIKSWRKQVEMIAAKFLLLPLGFSLVSAFQVIQPERRVVNRDGSVTITCEYKDAGKDWRMIAKLLISKNTVNTDCPHNCHRREEGNCTLFTLFNLQPKDKGPYFCEFWRTFPLPVQKQQGKGTLLISEPSEPPSQRPQPEAQGPDPSVLDWVLIGLILFFCFISLIVSLAYMQLRAQMLQSKEQGSLTYEPMQFKRPDPETTSEYMKMQRVQSGDRPWERDVNFNPYHAPDSFNRSILPETYQARS
ncbi:hypothetical protein JZ751_029338 [Albula glossodonta]|uniref:Immunoglobulin domain-containing protein n=1 Tax=Albula glossodonta TaxID=121402 RepID=A0A8T2PAN0_9TELE|nr:hypothetical protein JZ751_029338 [Albula glossodonta]